jgi:hypothetical protein
MLPGSDGFFGCTEYFNVMPVPFVCTCFYFLSSWSLTWKVVARLVVWVKRQECLARKHGALNSNPSATQKKKKKKKEEIAYDPMLRHFSCVFLL